MSLQQKFLLTFGPGWFAGITLGDWLRLLARNGFSVDPAYWPRVASISLYAAINTAFRWPESWLFDAKIRKTPVESPLFILGHPRSGTTHLHNLLVVDERFATPNFFQVNYPHTFLTAEAWATKILQLLHFQATLHGQHDAEPGDSLRRGVGALRDDIAVLLRGLVVSPASGTL